VTGSWIKMRQGRIFDIVPTTGSLVALVERAAESSRAARQQISLNGLSFDVAKDGENWILTNDKGVQFVSTSPSMIEIGGQFYSITEDVSGHIDLQIQTTGASRDIEKQTLEINDVLYEVTDNGDGTYTLFDGTNEYVSEAISNLVTINGVTSELDSEDESTDVQVQVPTVLGRKIADGVLELEDGEHIL